MRQWKKTVCLFLAAMMTFGAAIPAAASNNKRITSVSLEITSDIKVGDDVDNDHIDVETNSDKYTVDSWEILNPGFEWTEKDVPQIKVYLTAADGYYFSLTSSKIRLKGAEYVTASKKDSSTTLMITMNLPPLSESVEEMADITLGEDGIAYWDPVIGAGSYEVRVQRDGKNTGSPATVTNGSHSIREFLTKAGSYNVKVRPVNKVNQNVKGEWAESNSIYVDSARAADFRMGRVHIGGTWEESDGRWRFRNTDGSYEASGWKKIDGKWYCFDEAGYMRTGWIEDSGKWYYCDSSGAMVCDTEVEGYRLGSDGAMITQ